MDIQDSVVVIYAYWLIDSEIRVEKIVEKGARRGHTKV